MKAPERFQRRVDTSSGSRPSQPSLGSPPVARYPVDESDLRCLCSLGLLVSEIARDPNIDQCSPDTPQNAGSYSRLLAYLELPFGFQLPTSMSSSTSWVCYLVAGMARGHRWFRNLEDVMVDVRRPLLFYWRL